MTNSPKVAGLPSLPPLVTEAIACSWWGKSRPAIKYHIHRDRLSGYKCGKIVLLYTADLVNLWGPPISTEGIDNVV